MKTEGKTYPGGSEKMPHVVLIICDQLRADALGFMGNQYVRTPYLDRLAREGVVFENMFVQTPVCIGSRSCLLTGRYLRTIRMGAGGSVLDPREITLAETLQRTGYRTGMFGKLHLTPQQYTYKNLHSDRPISDAAPFLEAAGLPSMLQEPFKKNYGFQHIVGYEDATIIPPDLHPSSFIAESAARYFIENHRNSSCFLHVSFVDPHHPFDPPEEILRNYNPSQMPLPKWADTGGLVWPGSIRKRRTDFSSVTPSLTRKTIACYYAMIDMIEGAVLYLLAGKRHCLRTTTQGALSGD